MYLYLCIVCAGACCRCACDKSERQVCQSQTKLNIFLQPPFVAYLRDLIVCHGWDGDEWLLCPEQWSSSWEWGSTVFPETINPATALCRIHLRYLPVNTTFIWPHKDKWIYPWCHFGFETWIEHAHIVNVNTAMFSLRSLWVGNETEEREKRVAYWYF